MSKQRTRLMSTISLALVLVLALTVILIRFYPYSYQFSACPKVTQTRSGAVGDPINLLFVGTKSQITQSFQKAGWRVPDPITPQTSAKIAAASLAHRSYPTAPVSNLYIFGHVQDMAFEKPTTDVQNREHIRIWKTSARIESQPVWLGAATYDSGIELSSTTHFPTHHIAPTVDLERNAVGADLATTGLVREKAYAAFTPPILFARNGGGDYYESDGNLLVINYTRVPLRLTQAAWGVDGLKTGLFLFYDALFTVVGALIAFLVLVVLIVVGLILWRVVERNRSLKQTGLNGRVFP